MAASLNQCNFIGRVGKTPDIRFTASGTCCANFSIAVDERVKAASGEWETKTEWINIVFFGKTAETIQNHVDKGSLLFITGRFQTRQWTDKDGNKRYSSEIFGDRMVMLGGKGDGGKQQSQQSGGTPDYEDPTFMPDDEIPF